MIANWRWRILKRQARQTWNGWRASGLLMLGSYLGIFGLILLVSAWQSYRFPLATPAPALTAALACVWWLSAGLVNRPAFGTSVTDWACPDIA